MIINIILITGLIVLAISNRVQQGRINYLQSQIDPAKDEKVSKVIVKEIPKRVSIEDVDPDYAVVKDIIKSIELEGWKSEIKRESVLSYTDAYQILYTNPSNTIEMNVRFYLEKSRNSKVLTPSFGYSIIKSPNGVITYDSKTMGYDIDLFFVNQVIKYHQDINDRDIKYYKETIDSINKNLKTLNRDRKLDSIL